MPRKRRIEYAGAIYHVISRGNYRKDLFTQGKSGEAFEASLFEAVERCGWNVYAYVIMSNHYHLAVETPSPNLVAGMKWLQGTFATRFNRWHNERGHVFQGRYKAILVAGERPLGGLIDYIHLNPVRAGLCGIGDLKEYRLSSYSKYWSVRVRAGLDRALLLSLHGLPDTRIGMRKYEQHLAARAEAENEVREELDRQYCRGWLLGSIGERKQFARELEERESDVDWEGADLRELNEEKWERIVMKEMARLGKTAASVNADLKGAAWKVEIARRLRRETTASNPWIAKRLHMGHPNRVSNLVHEKY